MLEPEKFNAVNTSMAVTAFHGGRSDVRFVRLWPQYDSLNLGGRRRAQNATAALSLYFLTFCFYIRNVLISFIN
jgi:hypothetical protein